MGQKIPTEVSFFKAVYICFLVVFRPSRLIELEEQDSSEINNASADSEPRVQKVHNAFLASLALILAFVGVGTVAGYLLKYLCGTPSSGAVSLLQIIGVGLLLWGTLFVRGFEIQSYSCVTLGERVNQWLYRALYCMGTAIIISSLVWGLV